MRSSLNMRACAVATGLSLSGCFAVADVDRFHVGMDQLGSGDAAATPMTANYTDFKLTLIGMKPHVNQLFEYRIISNSKNFIVARGIINPLGSPNVTIYMPLGVPPQSYAPFRLDFYGDVNMSGGYDGIGSVLTADHAWRKDPLSAPVGGVTQLTFTHDTLFTHIENDPSGNLNPAQDTTLGATVHVINATALMGDLIQVRIVEPATPRSLGVYRVPAITQAAFDMTIPGVIDGLNDFEVWVYVDKNANGTYESPVTSPGQDLGWIIPHSSDAAGLNVTFDASDTTTADKEVGDPWQGP